MKTPRNSPRKPISAYERMVAILAKRDHSQTELRAKLKRAEHPPEEIDAAIEIALESKWLPDEATLATREANRMARAGKSRTQIFAWLRNKGLPTDALTFEDDEVESAYKVAEKSWARLLRSAEKDAKKSAQKSGKGFSQKMGQQRSSSLEANLKLRIARLLAGRGFSGSTARTVSDRLLREHLEEGSPLE